MTPLSRRVPLLARPIPLALVLGLASVIPVGVALERVVTLPFGIIPADGLRLAVAPVSLFLHALAGSLFGILGPLQLIGALRARFGRVHRLAGGVFVACGLGLGLSGLSLLLAVEPIATPLITGLRALAGVALPVALALGLAAAKVRDLRRHRAWMLRAYAIGMGSGSVAVVFFPIFVVAGEVPQGLAADALFAAWWIGCVVLAEIIIRRIGARA